MVHEPKPIQTTRSPWGQGRRAMGGPRSPQTLVHEGIYAIKVSMKTHLTPTASLYIAGLSARTIYALRVHRVCSRVY